MSARPNAFEREYYGKLVGRQISAVLWEKIDGRPLPVLLLNGCDSDGNAATVAVLCDPEGNGEGHLEPHPMRGLDETRIRSIRFDCDESPVRATVWTKNGMVRVEWMDVTGDRCWFASGTGDAKREAVPAIEHIEQMCQSLR